MTVKASVPRSVGYLRPVERARHGMTLIEVLVSMSVGAVVVAAVLGVLSTAHRTREQGEQRSDLFQSVRVALGAMERDLRVAVYRSDDPQFEFIGTNLTEDGLPADTVEFSTESGTPLNSLLPTGDLLRVQYYVDLGEDSLHTGLVRQAIGLPLTTEISPEQEELAAREYCPAAVGLDITYYDPTEQTWVEDWQERTELPSSVRIVLYVLPEAMEDSEEVEATPASVMPFSTVVHLMLADAPLGEGQPSATTTEGGLEGEGQPEGGEPGAEGPPESGQPSFPGGSGELPELPGMPGGGGGR
jgi:prepilin-type N-terminal cleavage/methylation domain-containing protein